MKRVERTVVALLALASLSFLAFAVLVVADANTQALGLSVGVGLAALAAAAVVTGKRLVRSDQAVEPRAHLEDAGAREEVEARLQPDVSRRRLLQASAAATGTVLLAGATTVATALGPAVGDSIVETPWRRGRRLVDDKGKPYKASDISEEAFYTAYPEGRRKKEEIGGPVVIVRVDPLALKLPPGRADWDAGGIVAYSKICTHAACAVALYRKPLFPAIEPRPALVCPCHYSTFDPAEGAKVIFGPAGRPLPQLPLYVDSRGYLRARGNLSGPPGPAWWGVRSGPARES
jgi:ubiquinol-cytochrome c reductase iron-sulfur subunit